MLNIVANFRSHVLCLVDSSSAGEITAKHAQKFCLCIATCKDVMSLRSWQEVVCCCNLPHCTRHSCILAKRPPPKLSVFPRVLADAERAAGSSTWADEQLPSLHLLPAARMYSVGPSAQWLCQRMYIVLLLSDSAVCAHHSYSIILLTCGNTILHAGLCITEQRPQIFCLDQSGLSWSKWCSSTLTV